MSPLSAALALALALALPVAPADDPPTPPAHAVPFTLDDGLVIVELHVGEHGPYRFSVDTGASGAGRLDAALVEQLGLEVVGSTRNRDGAGGEREQQLVRVPSLRLGERRFDDVTLPVGDYAWVRGDGERRVHGVLGYALLARGVFELDFRARQLRFDLEPLFADEPDVFAFDASPGVPAIPLAIGDQQGQALLDTGHDGALSMPAGFLELLALADEPVDAGTAVTALSRFPIRAATLADAVRIGPGLRLDGVRAHFADAWRYPLVGTALLRDAVVRVDHAQGLMRWTPRAAPGVSRRPEDPR